MGAADVCVLCIVAVVAAACLWFLRPEGTYNLRVINGDMLSKYYGPTAYAKLSLCWPREYMR
jgi:hypothetical protein